MTIFGYKIAMSKYGNRFTLSLLYKELSTDHVPSPGPAPSACYSGTSPAADLRVYSALAASQSKTLDCPGQRTETPGYNN